MWNMYMYIWMYICICVYVYLYIMYIYMCICIYMWTCICIYLSIVFRHVFIGDEVFMRRLVTMFLQGSPEALDMNNYGKPFIAYIPNCLTYLNLILHVLTSIHRTNYCHNSKMCYCSMWFYSVEYRFYIAQFGVWASWMTYLFNRTPVFFRSILLSLCLVS
jgi:hypothetical protein